ncbi:outer membrane protein [Bacteroides reticulotermitis JCM 10512]|uniref:Outer membrane protein n=1 Tax=Bacteroides reticulotermitis JCM 10512 TaxID=1445607 RepID=W4UWC8_9BACE|nr:outer membrane protein [Bacteroides reticulotermitis JCM 10512]
MADALAIINKVRVRANLKELDVNLSETDELEMLELLLNERDIEFAAELKRWYDLVRFGKSKSYKYKEQFITKIAEENSSANDSWIRSVLKNPYAWYLPIHNNEIEVNAALVQNPYYGVTN